MTTNQPAAKPSSAGGIAAGGILAVLLVIVVASCVNSETDEPAGGDEVGAQVVCEDFVTDRLKSPATAEFTDAVAVPTTNADEFEVTGNVDSENGFGAMLRSSYTCTVVNTGGDNWRLVDLSIT